MDQQSELPEPEHWSGPEPSGATRRVYLGIMEDLEQRRMVPGQRLVETELATRFGVGRNAVREAMQHLAVRGVVDLTRHRSAAIRKLDRTETLEVLEVAEAMTCLAVRAAAKNYDAEIHDDLFSRAMADLSAAASADEPGLFSSARRRFYRALLAIGGNRELQRLFPAIGMHIIYSQYQSPRVQAIRVTDYHSIHAAIVAGNADAAEKDGRAHVEHIRQVILETA